MEFVASILRILLLHHNSCQRLLGLLMALLRLRQLSIQSLGKLVKNLFWGSNLVKILQDFEMLHGHTMDISIYLRHMPYKLPILLSCRIQKFLQLSVGNFKLHMFLLALKELLVLCRYQKVKVIHFRTKCFRVLNSMRTQSLLSITRIPDQLPKINCFRRIFSQTLKIDGG